MLRPYSDAKQPGRSRGARRVSRVRPRRNDPRDGVRHRRRHGADDLTVRPWRSSTPGALKGARTLGISWPRTILFATEGSSSPWPPDADDHSDTNRAQPSPEIFFFLSPAFVPSLRNSPFVLSRSSKLQNRLSISQGRVRGGPQPHRLSQHSPLRSATRTGSHRLKSITPLVVRLVGLAGV
jgi:hypothetical protein